MKNYSSFKQTFAALNNAETTCLAIVENYLSTISEKNAEINAFVEVFAEEALEKAKIIDQKISDGTAGQLAGMVIGVKDNICIKNHKLTASSKILDGFESLFNATVIEKLLAEDVIIIGRLNCDEFAMGSANENSVYGSVKNPHNLSKVPGGSSGGSAAAVASNFCLAALGSDTGGSIRQPAAFCGVVGLKPTYSRVSRYGLIAYSSSFDQIGPITNNVEDTSLILEVIAGKDKMDSTSSSKEVENYSLFNSETKSKKIAVVTECLENEKLDSEIRFSIEETIEKLKKNGHTVEMVSFPFLDQLVPTYYVLTTAEASSNLARFDGVHYGYRSKETSNLEETYTKSRTEGFGKEVQRRIMLGTFVLSAGYHEAYFTKAQQIRRVIQDATNEILKDFDFILTPTTPHTAFELGQKHKDPTVMYLEDIFTVQANLSGHPAISLPLFKHSNGMPFALQLLAKNFEEQKLLSFSNYLMEL
ncbi:MAG: Asp-tRNA(Asn)/Glu-tRNA(Gln) amidotransferase subunit GatA [Flavobacteriales bacterium]|nr:Asp-tRNA(Asn)/Glu-tRNA(Gln) amidotransferase subunit GatA [Flavobacteriales bacterium]